MNLSLFESDPEPHPHQQQIKIRIQIRNRVRIRVIIRIQIRICIKVMRIHNTVPSINIILCHAIFDCRQHSLPKSRPGLPLSPELQTDATRFLRLPSSFSQLKMLFVPSVLYMFQLSVVEYTVQLPVGMGFT
jgi:hypothetical protein